MTCACAGMRRPDYAWFSSFRFSQNLPRSFQREIEIGSRRSAERKQDSLKQTWCVADAR
jgi:hypothetical protein